MREVKTSVEIDSAHRLSFHKGKCQNLHGHRWKIEVRVSSWNKEEDMVIDFGVIKGLISEWDHKVLVYERDDVLYDKTAGMERIVLGFETTAENIATYWARTLRAIVGEGHDVVVEVFETPINSATAAVMDSDLVEVSE